MQVQKINNQSFGMAVKYSPDYETVRTFIHSNYNREVNDKVGIITKLQAKNPVDILKSMPKEFQSLLEKISQVEMYHLFKD